MIKRAYNIQMTYDISDSEKMYAEQALQVTDYLLGVVENFAAHLDMMYLPFKENPDITTEQIWKFRATFREYRDQAKENWTEVQHIGLRIVKLMNAFMSDTQIEKIMRSFNTSVEDVGKSFDDFLILFKNLQAQDFKENAVKTIESIKKEIAQLKEIIEERVQNILEKDILGKSWIDSTNDDDRSESVDLTPQKPFDIQLFEERQRNIKETEKA